MAEERDKSGRFAKGHTPYHGGGRPKGFKGVAKLIMAETKDGTEMVVWAMKLWQDSTQPMCDRKWAFEWLSDRGLGKPVARTELEATIERVSEEYVAPMSDEQWAVMCALFTDDTGDGAPPTH